jgi:hypothetical protein
MKSYIVWDITSCSPLKVNRRFGGTFASIFRVETQARQETSVKSTVLAYSLTLRVGHAPPKHRLTFIGLHGVISHKRELFKVILCFIIRLHSIHGWCINYNQPTAIIFLKIKTCFDETLIIIRWIFTNETDQCRAHCNFIAMIAGICMQPNPPWGAKGHSATRECPNIWWNPKVHCLSCYGRFLYRDRSWREFDYKTFGIHQNSWGCCTVNPR